MWSSVETSNGKHMYVSFQTQGGEVLYCFHILVTGNYGARVKISAISDCKPRLGKYIYMIVLHTVF